MFGFSSTETTFFVAGEALSQVNAYDELLMEPAPPARRSRRAPLAAIVSVLVAGAAVLAWFGPGRAATPSILSHLQVAAPAQVCQLHRALVMLQPAAVSNSVPTVSTPELATRRPAHPATANRSRSRHR
jgi:hypothetical protein